MLFAAAAATATATILILMWIRWPPPPPPPHIRAEHTTINDPYRHDGYVTTPASNPYYFTVKCETAPPPTPGTNPPCYFETAIFNRPPRCVARPPGQHRLRIKDTNPPCHFETAILVDPADALTTMMAGMSRKKKICDHVT
ncbi:hypothetical protein [Absidia glauca]|uniref:Uncharacterized protein n=1 Tax=Absidia glauca TaxID=4829 RepID=A0A163MS48_ABSGL|nr:hypothetical protein [Absidia glauca]